jgi:hypothetical protein
VVCVRYEEIWFGTTRNDATVDGRSTVIRLDGNRYRDSTRHTATTTTTTTNARPMVKRMTMKKTLALGALALASGSASVVGANAATYATYSAMDAAIASGAAPTITPTVSFGADACVANTQTLKAGADSITVAWTGVNAGDTVDVKLCYTDIASKPWRKFKDAVKKNKKCKQTAVEKDNLVVGATGTSVTIPVELNIAPAMYTIQVLSKDSTGGYTSYANDACAFTVDTYERLPTNLVGTMSFFIAFSIIVATAGTWYDYKKQNAAAAAWSS